MEDKGQVEADEVVGAEDHGDQQPEEEAVGLRWEEGVEAALDSREVVDRVGREQHGPQLPGRQRSAHGVLVERPVRGDQQTHSAQGERADLKMTLERGDDDERGPFGPVGSARGDQADGLEGEPVLEPQRQGAGVRARDRVVEQHAATADQVRVNVHGDAQGRVDSEAGVHEVEVALGTGLRPVDDGAEADLVQPEIHRAELGAERDVGRDGVHVVHVGRVRRAPGDRDRDLVHRHRSEAFAKRDGGVDHRSVGVAVAAQGRVAHPRAGPCQGQHGALDDQAAFAAVA